MIASPNHHALPRLGSALRLVLARAGDWLLRHQRHIRRLQWAIIAVYVVLVAAPAFLPLPDRTAHVWNNLTVLAQFAFWGIWWPFVLLSMVLVGRSWCGFFCPEGALTEIVSRRGKGRAVPRWITWPGWPFVAFALTTIYGQMVSVYQYPKPVLVILGGSTLGAMAVGFFYGRNKRVWCRYLCPVNGVFGLLAKLAPVHFRVDHDAWGASQARHERPRAVNCAPLVPIRTMEGNSLCHMCGRCSGFRDAIALEPRAPNREIVEQGGLAHGVHGARAERWETVLILFGLMGIAVGAFHWNASPWFVAGKQWIAEWLVNHDIVWPLEATLPWWLLTDYPAQNDVMSLLDGALLLAYIGATALAMGLALGGLLAIGTRVLGRWSWARFHHLAQALIPQAGVGVFLGLSALTVTLLKGEGLAMGWIGLLRGFMLAGATSWSAWLGWRVARRYAGSAPALTAGAAVLAAAALSDLAWALLFWVW